MQCRRKRVIIWWLSTLAIGMLCIGIPFALALIALEGKQPGLKTSIGELPTGCPYPPRRKKVPPMIDVCERKRVPANCKTCLYGPNAIGWDGKPVGRMGCGHADRQRDWMLYAIYGAACPSYWLDQNRFERR